MKSDQIQALFDRIAPVYDELNTVLSFGQHRIWKQMAVKWSGAKPGDVCLDLCCGSGDLAQMLAEKVGKTGQVYGVDFSSAQLAVASDRATRRCLKPAIQWVESDVLTLPFSDNQFDC
ncbi:MAG: class I SAM-dependent methyltransferase, partial [Candidatus Parcubacteria bacterium]|nr:class I SAM-dependent methyltransferase [Leptolyngbyaceae cyanobacterium LF-bin-113]